MKAADQFSTLGSLRGSEVPMPARRWKTRVLLPLAIVGVALAVLGRAAWSSIAPAHAVEGTPVVLAAVEGRIEVDGTTYGAREVASGASVQAAGWIEPSPFAVFATALTDGVVAEILTLEGDRVTKGQVVARLVTADAALGVARADADLRKQVAVRDAAKQELANVVGLDRARLVAEARLASADATIAQFTAEVAQAKAKLAETEDELARKRTLVDTGGVSAAEIARLGFRLDAERAMVDALGAKRAMIEAARAEATAELSAARRDRELLVRETSALAAAEADVALSEAMLQEAQLRLARTEIQAPIDGVVLARLAAPGMMVSTSAASADGGRIVSLYDPASLQVRADVPNADIALVGVGQAAEVRVEALPETVCRGEVLRITAQADIAKNTVQVKILLKDPPPQLRPDMLCRVKILGGSTSSGTAPGASAGGDARQRLYVPKRLVHDGHVTVAGPLRDGLGRAESRTVTLGRDERAGWIEVTEGLRPGDVVLDPGQARDGDRVRVTVRREGGAS